MGIIKNLGFGCQGNVVVELGLEERIPTAQRTVPALEGLTDHFQKQGPTESCPEQLSRQA